ncbi:hypothetical protein [Parafrankia sp. EUN1f]|uniref:hypothetical protein n=1 Tax=Parafrankia sp. EUN1f TaxID=102897 RepID=UPI0001C459A9|nr:hypothetical protein [Parafrankia sp. EUN1f]EFC86496.1 hypothetical protein FrEUN1fDRAFT_0391 [Parafrankia sp. EUN1f]
MSHPSKIRGTRWESAVRDYLRENFRDFGAARPEDIERNGDVHGRLDQGDIRGVTGFVIECKDEEKIRLAGYMAEAKRERENANTRYYAAVVKARRKTVEQAYVVMELDQFREIVRDLRGYHVS